VERRGSHIGMATKKISAARDATKVSTSLRCSHNVEARAYQMPSARWAQVMPTME
jgi:hypothetical protein